jgi:uncharacterized protein YijF (DUF1287 family)
MPKRTKVTIFSGLIVVAIACLTSITKFGFVNQHSLLYAPNPSAELAPNLLVANAAETRLQKKVIYDPSYYSIPYPNGDIPPNKGVCTDVIIRSYRELGIDLQKLVHEDISANFIKYPKIWRLTMPDKNIDHRRVPNLMTFFERHGASLPITKSPETYKPGHIVTWDLGRGTTHIGIVSNKVSSNGTFMIIHNIGSGPVLEDTLFNWEIIGHYNYP